MRRIAYVGILVVLPVAVVADDAAARKQLEGVWKGRVHDGATGHEITFNAEFVSGVKDGTRDLGRGAYTVDQSSAPWRMDATEVKKDGAKGKPYWGIYKLDGDSLTWCVGTKDVPTKFATGDGQFMLVLKRQAAGAAEKPKDAPPATSSVKKAAAGQYRVAEVREPAPNQLSASVREGLSEGAVRVSTSDGQALFDLWLRKQIPVASASAAASDRKYPVDSGALVGAIQITKQGLSDFRELKVKPGVYTLRYGVQPTDGNHEATGQFRDFLVLLSPSADSDPASIKDARKLSDLGLETAGEGHPAILYLAPPRTGPAKVPAIASTPASDAHSALTSLVVKTGATGNEAVQEVRLELVVSGMVRQ